MEPSAHQIELDLLCQVLIESNGLYLYQPYIVVFAGYSECLLPRTDSEPEHLNPLSGVGTPSPDEIVRLFPGGGVIFF